MKLDHFKRLQEIRSELDTMIEAELDPNVKTLLSAILPHAHLANLASMVEYPKPIVDVVVHPVSAEPNPVPPVSAEHVPEHSSAPNEHHFAATLEPPKETTV